MATISKNNNKSVNSNGLFVKTSFLVAIVLLLSLLLGGCDYSSHISQQPKNSSKLKTDLDGWCYKRLPAKLQSGYVELYSSIIDSFDRDETIRIYDAETDTEKSYNGIKVKLSQSLQSKQEALQLYNALIWDNPEFFYISNLYNYEGYHSKGKDYYDTFGLVYLVDASIRKSQKAQLEESIDLFLDKLNRSDQFETELELHDRLLEKVTYETATKGLERPIEKYPAAFTVYGALVEGRAVCEGYARAMQLLLNRVGIECTPVVGKDQSGLAHMWNFVTIDGKNYHLDPTWNDSGDKIRHNLFNLTTKEIEITHTIDADNVGVDTCVSKEAQYYIKKGLYVDSFDSGKIAKVIAENVKNGVNQIEMQFGTLTYSKAQLLFFEKKVLMEKVNAILQPYNMTMWSYKNYVQDDNYHVLIIENEH